MPEEHRHCVVCGKVTTQEKFFCSPPCEEVFKKQQKRLAHTRFLIMLTLIVLFLLIFVFRK